MKNPAIYVSILTVCLSFFFLIVAFHLNWCTAGDLNFGLTHFSKTTVSIVYLGLINFADTLKSKAPDKCGMTIAPKQSIFLYFFLFYHIIQHMNVQLLQFHLKDKQVNNRKCWKCISWSVSESERFVWALTGDKNNSFDFFLLETFQFNSFFYFFHCNFVFIQNPIDFLLEIDHQFYIGLFSLEKTFSYWSILCYNPTSTWM